MIQENPIKWSEGFHGSEHPETARLRVEKDYVDRMIGLKRENMDRIFEYLTALIDKAKEELGHARSGGSSAEHRRLALRQHIDEIIAYLKGQALDIEPPAVYGEEAGQMRGQYRIDAIPQFLGQVKCVLDQWYDSHLIALYDEMVVLMHLKGPKAAAGQQ